jgi:hypothetical protein
MDLNAITLSKARAWFLSFRLSMEPSTLKYVTGKNTLRGFLLHAMSPWYYRRERLWKEGTLFWIYAFKVASPMGDFKRPQPGWALFSPAQSIQDHPQTYETMHNRLQQWLTSSEAQSFPKLVNTMNSLTSEPLMVPLPDSVSEGLPWYLTSVTFYPDHFDYPQNGLLFAVGQLQLTQEVMLLPKQFYEHIQ